MRVEGVHGLRVLGGGADDTHSGSRASHTEAYKTRKHPGYIRNQFGGYFTS